MSSQWVIKVESDQVKGPYSTDAVIKMITNGVFSGSEEICAYPDGEWKALTKQPEFYDAILESLENPIEVDQKKSEKMDAETIIRVIEKKSNDTEVEKIVDDDRGVGPEGLKEFLAKQLSEEKEKKSSNRVAFRDSSKPAITKPSAAETAQKMMHQSQQNYIEQMSQLKSEKRNQFKKFFPLFFIFTLGLLAAAYYLYFEDDQQVAKSKWILIDLAKKADAPMTAEQIKTAKKNAVLAFQNGPFEKLLESQGPLVNSVQSSEKDLEGVGLLCVVYEQLWPFTQQTPNDLKSILSATQMARSINPISKYSDTCQSIYLLTKGQGKEARSLIEQVLDSESQEKFNLLAFLYQIKGEIFESESSFVNAEAYYKQTAEMWPQWVSAQFGLARMLYKQNKYEEAKQIFAKLNIQSESSKLASYGLGMTEIKMSGNNASAILHFEKGFKIKQVLPKDFHTEALLLYAQALLDVGNKEQALVVAQEGYGLSPSHRGLKEIVISLGGDEKIENAQNEIILIGDQFARAGDHRTAQAQYKAAFEIDNKNAVAAYKAAKSLWQINQTRDAIVWLEKSLEVDAKMLQSYILKADFESQKYDFQAAARTLTLASKNFPKNHEVTKMQAIVEFRKNNMPTAIQYGEKAVKMYDADVELLTMLAQAYINFYLNAPTNGPNALNAKDNAKTMAQKYAARAADLEPAWPEAQITRAKSLAAFDGAARGETYLKEFIKAYPYTIEYRNALAEFYSVNEKYYDAIAVYEEIVKIDPKNKKANFGLAEAYRIVNKEEDAQKFYNAASMLDPSDVEPMFANAKLLIENASSSNMRERVEQALAKLQLVKKINPDFPKVSYMIAKCYLELGNYERSLEFVAEEKAKNPNIADSYILAAEIYTRTGKYKECAAENAAAIRMRPNRAELYIRAAICYRNSESLDLAQDMVDMAFNKESGFAENFREQGYIFEKQRQKGNAVDCFKRYIGYSPNAVDRAAVEAKINQLGEGLNGVCRQPKESY